jgi:hypothetical protein
MTGPIVLTPLLNRAEENDPPEYRDERSRRRVSSGIGWRVIEFSPAKEATLMPERSGAVDAEAVSRRLTEAAESARRALAIANTPTEKEAAIKELKRAVRRLTQWTLDGIPPFD